MNIELQLEGQDVNEQTLLSIQEWIKQERIQGLRVQPKTGAPTEGQMGLEIGKILGLVIKGTKQAEKLIGSLYNWLKKVNRGKLKIKLKTNDFEFEMDSENPSEQQTVINSFLELIKNSSER